MQRKGGKRRTKRSRCPNFNGAAALMQRKVYEKGKAFHLSINFNGAAALMQRKAKFCQRLGDELRKLQWGRCFDAAES